MRFDGSDIDIGLGITVDTNGIAYVVGTTKNSNFPTSANAYQRLPSGGYRQGFIVQSDDAEGGQLPTGPSVHRESRERLVAGRLSSNPAVAIQTSPLDPSRSSTFCDCSSPLGSAMV
jgi:hypothetical protein